MSSHTTFNEMNLIGLQITQFASFHEASFVAQTPGTYNLLVILESSDLLVHGPHLIPFLFI
jgi:hypothetical protein